MEVLHVDVLVGGGFPLAPQQQAFLGGHFLNGNVLDGEAQDDGPDHTKGHLEVTINDFCTDSEKEIVLIQSNFFEYLNLKKNCSF